MPPKGYNNNERGSEKGEEWRQRALAYLERYRREHEAAEKLNETNHSLPRNLDGEVRTE